MKERRKQYPFDEIEPKWQKIWDKEKTYSTPNPGDEGFDGSKPKYYVLDMFPYPSGAGLHVGHPEGYTATDIMARYKRLKGFNVLHPMGWDAFGLPAEQYAIKTGQHPRITTDQNVDHFRKQLKRIGFSYDWDREVNTTDPNYFKWTQWIFLQLYNSYFDPEEKKAKPIPELKKARKESHPDEKPKDLAQFLDEHRLAYIDEVPVNWCPELGTVLANEEVIDGKSERGGHPVERRPMKQWMLRITAYADRLIDELEGLDWPEGIKLHQRNWIGRSEGAEVDFKLDGHDKTITVYTTRPDTLYGATYMVLAPEHAFVDEIVSDDQRKAVEKYRKAAALKSDLDRTELAKDKTGVFTGAYAINPVNDEKIPVWIADYVLITYGTGAIMAVPAHDDRDHEFAEKFEIPIVQVVQAPEDFEGTCFTGEGTAINSPAIEGLPTKKAKKKIIHWLSEKGVGKKATNFKLRDWLFSRQRYWGEPFPIVWGKSGHKGVPLKELPVELPEMDDFKPTGTTEPPLSKAGDWVQYSETAKRELNTMPQWAGSCWYYLRYCDPNNDKRFIGKKAEKYWMDTGKPGGVDLYVGGTEHAVLHLLYARFWHKVLYDLGHLSTVEPFQKLVNQGLILGENGEKMSKSKGNVVNPDDVIDEYGADSLRLFEMFMGPLEQVKPWSTKGVEGVHRFLARVWRLCLVLNKSDKWEIVDKIQEVEPAKGVRLVEHQTIKKVTEDIESLSFNTAISQMMVLTNELTQAQVRPLSSVVSLLRVLNPFAPHITEDLYATLAKKFKGLDKKQLCEQEWPTWVDEFLVEDEIEIAVQVNGKLRDRIMIPKDLDKAAIESQALESEKVKGFTDGKTVRKVIVVPGRLVNIVAN